MANTKQQKKRNLQNEKRRQRNVSVRSRMRTFLKKADTALGETPADAEPAVKDAIIEIDVAARKGVIHKNAAARRKSRLQKKLNAAKSA